ncbi:hypothetical protein EC912_11063 [Luteibacter rhizovicinus]|uniref:Secreted protein n=1 Tax=Luteibacter rhizovicinus TaxID=242606 RepID=A0A4R3YLF1_9GAMM|nr:hypothetical protein [Luteibacter rhizovicinus]TCV91633.1 hypothetical protein EC912_11063 [Luteibacter rhizovicinus]
MARIPRFTGRTLALTAALLLPVTLTSPAIAADTPEPRAAHTCVDPSDNGAISLEAVPCRDLGLASPLEPGATFDAEIDWNGTVLSGTDWIDHVERSASDSGYRVVFAEYFPRRPVCTEALSDHVFTDGGTQVHRDDVAMVDGDSEAAHQLTVSTSPVVRAKATGAPLGTRWKLKCTVP